MYLLFGKEGHFLPCSDATHVKLPMWCPEDGESCHGSHTMHYSNEHFSLKCSTVLQYCGV